MAGAGQVAWWTSSGDAVQQIALQALGSRRSRTPVRLKWLEAGQGVDAIFTPTLNLVRFSRKRVCRRHMLPGSPSRLENNIPTAQSPPAFVYSHYMYRH
jgi:hypothetical protein